MKLRRIGIFGGTFDPVHRGHVALLRAAQRHFRFDRVYVVPTGQNPLKTGAQLPKRERLARLQRAVRPLAFARISRIEWAGRGPRYTVETLRIFRRRHPRAELFFICGSDALESFRRWKDPEGILRLATVASARRAGYAAPKTRPGIVTFPMQPVRLSSTAIRRGLASAASGRKTCP